MSSFLFSLLQALDWLSSPTHRLSHSCPCPHSGQSSSSPCWWCWVWTARWDNPGTKWGKSQKCLQVQWWCSLLESAEQGGVLLSHGVRAVLSCSILALLMMPTATLSRAAAPWPGPWVSRDRSWQKEGVMPWKYSCLGTLIALPSYLMATFYKILRGKQSDIAKGLHPQSPLWALTKQNKNHHLCIFTSGDSFFFPDNSA